MATTTECNTETQDFHWTELPISHPKRRRLILEKYPEIDDLSGYDLRAGAYAICVVLLNLYIAYYWIYINDASWFSTILLTYICSGTLNHILYLAMHEASHCALFPWRSMHEYFVIFSNLSMGVPAGMGFIRYHLDHHVYMGVDGLDPDLPTAFEARLLSSKWGKFFFILLLPLTYTIRPLLVNPKPMVWMEVLNWTVIILWDIGVFYFGGMKPLVYLMLGAFLSMSIHPLNGHLIAEHYQFPDFGEKLQETYSTYGWENYITFFAGYHLEHHDFPRIPGFKLPKLKSIAKEFYDLPHHKCWLVVIYDFIMNDHVTPYCRVKRTSTYGGHIKPPHKSYIKDNSELGKYWNGPSEKTQ